MAVSSKIAFAAALKEMELDVLAPKFAENGWDTFADFAFSTSDPSGKDHELFESQVVKVILAPDGSQKRLVPKLRRLYAQSYIAASSHMTEQANPKGIEEKVSMHPADRTQRTDDLRARLTGFKLSGQC